MPALSPVTSDRATLDLYFDLGGGVVVDAGDICREFRQTSMMNGGYSITGKLVDSHFNIIRRLLIEADYFLRARSNVFRCQFRLRWEGTDNRTPLQTAYVVAMRSSGADADRAFIEFTAIDPPSWFLNVGNASGRVFRGRVSDVIRQCVAAYAPGVILDVSETIDSANNRFWMMGMDPKTFLSSLLDWSSSVTRNKTQWLVAMNDMVLRIKEQADIPSQNVAFYAGPRCAGHPQTVRKWEVLADNALSILNSKLVTYGISAISGRYFDIISDVNENIVTVKDSTTPNKYKARTTPDRAFTKPPDGGPPTTGWTGIASVPEVYSGGEIGLQYGSYIDGRARSVWLNMANLIMRCMFRVGGHGIYSNSFGLGTNTITIAWFDIEGRPYFLSGNWIIFGFEHVFKPSSWHTDILCARLDFDAVARAVPIAAE